MTREEMNAHQREYRKRIGNANTKKYEKTPSGFLMRAYRNMQSRVTGVQKHKAYLYIGKELLPRETFYEWATHQEAFWKLFREWEQSRYDQRQTPTVDRVDSSRGYSLDNMEWITNSENSRRGATSPYRTTYYNRWTRKLELIKSKYVQA
jgi:hypothetical protein